MRVTTDQLKGFLIDSGLVTEKDIAELEKAGVADIGKALVDTNKISGDDLRQIMALILGVPFVDLKNQKIDIDILSLIPEPVARANNVIAFARKGDALEVAMLDINDLSAVDFIRKKVGVRILPRLTDSTSIKAVLVQYQKSLKAEFGDIIQKEADNIKTITEKGGDDRSADDLKKMAEDLPVVKIVDTLLKHAIIQNASDIHIEPQEEELVVRYRIDGLLHDAMVLPGHVATSITARIKVLSNLKLDEKRLPQDGRFKVDMEGEKVSFRVSILPTHYGEKTVMRLLRENASGFSLELLGFHGDALERLHKATTLATGLILTTGPTGSGKSTTLYTLLDILNTSDVNISTVEDPVEYQMKRVNQTQVRPDIGFTFSVGLRTLVRQDPDIIMVGEIRDNETASLAVNASLTGHLVLSTLHTNSAAGAIPRLIDMKVEPFLLVSTLSVIIGQRLVRKLGEHKERYTLSKAEIARLKEVVDLDRVIDALKKENIVAPDTTAETLQMYKPVPQGNDNDGYKGRVGIYEVLKMSPTIKDLVMKGATPDEMEKQAKKEGMLTMIEDGIFRAVQGETTIEEVLRVVTE